MKSPESWGPLFWAFLERLAICYQDRQKEAMEIFLQILPDLLPCSICGVHMRKHVKEQGLFKDMGHFLRDINTLHNAVNKSNKKKEFNEEESAESIIKRHSQPVYQTGKGSPGREVPEFGLILSLLLLALLAIAGILL